MLKQKQKKRIIQNGATSILLVMLVLSIILLMALTAATIISFEAKMNSELSNSAVAFYAADAAAEKCLYQARRLTPGSGEDCTKNNKPISIVLDNGATGTAEVKNGNQINASGIFSGTQRSVELVW